MLISAGAHLILLGKNTRNSQNQWGSHPRTLYIIRHFNTSFIIHVSEKTSHPYRKTYCGDQMILRPSYPLQWRHNGRYSVSNHQPHHCLLNGLFRHRSKKTSKLRVTGLCERNSPVTGEFPAQRASNAENVSIWWRHHSTMGFPTPIRQWLYVEMETLIFLFLWIILGSVPPSRSITLDGGMAWYDGINDGRSNDPLQISYNYITME